MSIGLFIEKILVVGSNPRPEEECCGEDHIPTIGSAHGKM